MASNVELPYFRENDTYLLVAEVLIPGQNGSDQTGRYGILLSDVQSYWNRRMGTQIAQLYELVIPGLILSKHIFQGLKRPLYCDESEGADRSKLVYSRKPTFDVEAVRGASPGNPLVVRREPPAGKVFVVVASPNDRHKQQFPTVDGWLDRWNWVEEDQGFSEAPANWLDRYDKRLYTGGITL